MAQTAIPDTVVRVTGSEGMALHGSRSGLLEKSGGIMGVISGDRIGTDG